MLKTGKLILAALLSASVLSACGRNNSYVMQQAPMFTQPVYNTYRAVNRNLQKPIFSKRRLGQLRPGIFKNSFAEQQKKQLKLHDYFFKGYAKGKPAYGAEEVNPHTDYLKNAEMSIGEEIVLDQNVNGEISWEEIKTFVTSKPYINYFRNQVIMTSFGRLDASPTDKKLTKEEFLRFNDIINLSGAAFDIEAEFQEFNYNNDDALTMDEYEDFYMKYLLLKYGV